ncbi:aspartate dehydrogenase [Angulomicrobium tetraedrale]|uniref:L-aspartate dehydrogenase n=1 Tax=Ancylobacter tetraedralis TaxID=217068 RepID=A0A839ZFD6_9HYPH|nr:aspartate dehydrogenase [Ancylobacter tetraedralis]MBB3773660.1 aspartate dehydrogenase [Ancylobacter tetraedralis]
MSSPPTEAAPAPSASSAHRGVQRVAIAGLGAVGLRIARALDAGLPGCVLAAVSANDRVKAGERLASLTHKVPVVAIEELEALADIVVECAPAALLPAIAEPFLRAGKTVIVLSSGAILTHQRLLDLAREHGGQIVVPTGALIGLDAVTAAAEGDIRSVRMITRKPVKGLVGAPYLVEHAIAIDDITEPLRVFDGTPREAAIGFPANLNVAVALALAGIGPDRTRLEIWADPALTRNTHTIEVDADSASFTMSIANVPTDNPKTGRITALSVISYLRKLNAPLRVGS